MTGAGQVAPPVVPSGAGAPLDVAAASDGSDGERDGEGVPSLGELRRRNAELRRLVERHLRGAASPAAGSGRHDAPRAGLPADRAVGLPPTRLGPCGYWNESVARCPDAGGEWYLGSGWTATPADSLAWMRAEAERLARALSPRPGEGPAPSEALRPAAATSWDPAGVLRGWAADDAYQRVQAGALGEGRPVSVNTRGPDRVCGLGGVEVLYSVSARPVRCGRARTRAPI